MFVFLVARVDVAVNDGVSWEENCRRTCGSKRRPGMGVWNIYTKIRSIRLIRNGLGVITCDSSV